jgi:uncharacterized membrane protein YccC
MQLFRVTVERLTELIANAHPTIIVAIAIILILLAAMSKHLLAFVGATLLALLGLSILLAPTYAAPIFAIACVAGSALASLFGIYSRRNADVTRNSLDALTQAVRRLETAENRRFMQSVTKTKRRKTDEVPEQKESTPTTDQP